MKKSREVAISSPRSSWEAVVKPEKQKISNHRHSRTQLNGDTSGLCIGLIKLVIARI